MPRRHKGLSEKKRKRERDRRAARMDRESSGRSSSSETVSKTQAKALRGKKELEVVDLKRIGRGRFWPTITSATFSKLNQGEHAQVGRYSYVVDKSVSAPGQVIFFDVVYDMELGVAQAKNLGTFKLNVTEKTIKRSRGN